MIISVTSVVTAVVITSGVIVVVVITSGVTGCSHHKKSDDGCKMLAFNHWVMLLALVDIMSGVTVVLVVTSGVTDVVALQEVFFYPLPLPNN